MALSADTRRACDGAWDPGRPQACRAAHAQRRDLRPPTEEARTHHDPCVPGVRVADDLVERQFRPSSPDVLWLADITYLHSWEGWLYLAAVQDAYSRRIVGWSMAEHMRTELVTDALRMAVHRRSPEPGLVHHSDQGSQGGFNRSSQRFVFGGIVDAR
jgi:transposase InsO family protein